jgi:hypothetical protein
MTIEMRSGFAFVASLALLSSAAMSGCTRPVRTDDMSATAHRREAVKERSEADEHLRQYDPNARARVPGGLSHGRSDVSAADVIVDYNPTSWNLGAAERHKAHAAEHERAAQELDRFEAEECKAFQSGVRSACPFIGPVRVSEEIPNGVRIRLAAGAPVATVAAHMRCHLAFARSRAFAVSECPLTLRGTEVGVTADGAAIEIISRDHSTVRELRRRAAALVEVAR